MCGIAGVVVHGGEAAPPTEALALEMARCQYHRGPDRQTAYVAPSGLCALGHARLRIIDLETGDQPMTNEDGSVWVVFNGEIYNFQELRRELEKAGHAFRSRSDTEVIVHGYEEWGDGVAERLDGMFAFGLWDERRGRLLLVRDRAGKKPLFIYEDDQRLLFASEMKAILSAPGVDNALDPRAIPLFLAYGYVPAGATFYRRIRKLPPAHCAVFESGRSTTERRYWSLDFTPRRTTRAEALERVRELTHSAVARRLVADVPLGAFLSGGVDSSIVVGLMAEAMGEPVRTFSIGFADDQNYDETSYARLVAERFETEHTEFRVEAQSVELLEDLLDAYDEPFGDSSGIPTSIVSRLTREHVTVALTGDGGDEVFAGYPRFLGAAIAEAIPAWAVQMGDAVGRRLPHNSDFRSFSRRFARFFSAASLPPEERTLRWIGFLADRLDSLLRPELSGLLAREELTDSFRRPLAANRHLPPLARSLALNFETYLPEDLLVKADRCSMLASLELRSPFLDTALMSFAASVPDRIRVSRGRLKWLLKEAFEDLLPPEIVRRRKMGFGIPLPTWFRNQWRPLLEARVLSSDAELWRWLRPEPVQAMAKAHLEGTADFGHQLFALLTLESWLARNRYSVRA